MESTRRSFITFLTSGLATTAGLALVGCGDDDGGTAGGGGGDDSGDCQGSGTTSTISANHGHDLLVSKEDALAGVEKTYDIAGGGGHSHMVTVTEAHFAELAGDQVVVVTSTTGAGHTHEVTIQCA
ncbi:MAG: hypothetical protein JRI68_12190 [Deltaproteobacteria bacterium]|nr:hypothetical protein [Deltaproteobacteria bacterium]